jgi:hypothetical protein
MTKSVSLVVCVVLSSVSLFAAEPSQVQTDYEAMKKWQFATTTISVAQPVTIKRDTATWTLNNGTVSLMQPISGGHVTGLVWRGEGRFAMTVPDRYEHLQLQRFAGKGFGQLDEPITDLVFRTSDDTIDKLFPGATKNAAFGNNDVAQKRHEQSLIDRFCDVDANVITGIANKTSYWNLTFKTANLDWLAYEYDPQRDEEIRVDHFEPPTFDTWLSLDRPEDRAPNGRPGSRSSRIVALSHIDVRADLTKYGRTGRIGESEQRTINAHFEVEEEWSVLAAGAQAISLELDPTAQNLTARDANGKSLTLLRDNIGGRSASMENKVNDSTLTVVLPEPLKKDDALVIKFEYDLEIPNYVAGNSWYPTFPGAFDEHTAKLTLTVNSRNQVRSMGRLAGETGEGKAKTSTWLVEKPTKMVTFATAERFEEIALEVKGIPTIVSFGWASGLDVKSRVRNSGADVANSMQFFQLWLDSPIGGDKFYVTSIVGEHGQAFENFLHLAESSYSEHPGASELFRAHETAHEWFGHRVGWASYRDQWLSESLAE